MLDFSAKLDSLGVTPVSSSLISFGTSDSLELIKTSSDISQGNLVSHCGLLRTFFEVRRHQKYFLELMNVKCISFWTPLVVPTELGGVEALNLST